MDLYIWWDAWESEDPDYNWPDYSMAVAGSEDEARALVKAAYKAKDEDFTEKDLARFDRSPTKVVTGPGAVIL